MLSNRNLGELCGWPISEFDFTQAKQSVASTAWKAGIFQICLTNMPFTLALLCGFPKRNSDTAFQDGRWFLGFNFQTEKTGWPLCIAMFEDAPQHWLMGEIGDPGYHQQFRPAREFCWNLAVHFRNETLLLVKRLIFEPKRNAPAKICVIYWFSCKWQ